ncbi:MAG: RNA polymerase sigma factor [Nevskia sp.]|nr:RNA polymerase sigma factor [Nevskia sp.]
MNNATEHAYAGNVPFDSGHVRKGLSVEDVIRRHHDALIRFLRKRLRTPEDASDVAQETYIRMMQYNGSTEVQSPSSMLYRIAINVANDLGRSEQVRRASDQTSIDDLELASDQPPPERIVAGMQDLSLLYDAIAHLPPKCQQVFLLSRVRGMTYPEIAQHCGISVKMVEKHIGRALSVCLKKVGGA